MTEDELVGCLSKLWEMVKDSVLHSMGSQRVGHN